MKYLNKKLIKKKKKALNFKRINYILLFFIIFFLGIWTERFSLQDSIKKFSHEIFNTLSNRVYSTINYDAEKLIININYKNYSKILSSREKSIKAFRASEDIHQWVAADLDFNKDKYKIRIKLKGVHKEHWEDPKKWSFKIKLLDEKSIDGFRRFSIQKPSTRDYLYEWLFMQALKKEGLIFHRTKFIQTNVNGENLGIYYLEEQHSKQLIENNKRREGPIIGLDKNLAIEEINNLQKLTINKISDSFWRAKVKPVQFDDDYRGTEQELYLKNAISLFEEFRKNKNKIDKIFDLEQLAKLMAIKTIFGSSEFDWKDIKFYYNPITSLLEPIGREVHISENFTDAGAWWIKNSQNLSEFNKENKQFSGLLFNDQKFYELYLTQLLRYTENNFIPKLIEENKLEFTKIKKLLQYNYPLENIFSQNHFNKTKKIIQDTLNPVQGINSYFINFSNNSFKISIQNTQRLPIEIKRIVFNNEETIKLKKPIIIRGKKHDEPVENYLVNFSCDGKEVDFCKKYLDEKNFILENSKIDYNILGQKKIKESIILKFYKDNITETKNKLRFDINNLENLSFLKIDYRKKELYFNQGIIPIDKRIVIPEGYTVFILPGTEIIFQKNGQILTYSPLRIIGEKNSPIKIRAKSPKDRNLYKYGNGISIINANKKSIIKNTIFSNLYSSNVYSGDGLLGAINIYRSDISFENCNFFSNTGEDFVNIISSNFLIKDLYMNNIDSDAIDFDFSKGIIENIKISNAGNDALDFSGSQVEANNIYISKVGDKGISIGEQSNIKITNLTIKNANIGIASKDLSKAKIENASIKESNIAAASYQKKPEFGPGYISFKKIEISEISKNYLAEKNSIIKVEDKLIEPTNINYAQF